MAAKKKKREIAAVPLRDPKDTSPLSFSEQIAMSAANLRTTDNNKIPPRKSAAVEEEKKSSFNQRDSGSGVGAFGVSLRKVGDIRKSEISLMPPADL